MSLTILAPDPVETAVDPTLNLFEEIERLKHEMNAVLLAHYYQESEIQDLADFVGDSLELARRASQTTADVIVFAGVHFMAETAKILNPTKPVYLPDLKAGCSLADSCPPDRFKAFREAHPDHFAITYINCSAAVKAMSDLICTSSSAEKLIAQVPPNTPILFSPDKNLGAYLMKKTGRPMTLWPGTCIVHEIFSEKKIVQMKTSHPDAKVIAHPECEEAVLRLADFIGSTSALLRHVQTVDDREFIVATESGILHQMEKACPDKTFLPAPPNNNCACNECPHMKLNTLEKLYLCMKNRAPEITMDEEIRIRALAPLQKMLAMS
jgi:quinolinate synthase